MTRLVPLRRSLLVRLLATSLLIAVCAIAATAWLAVQLTKQAVTQEQSRTLSADTDIYDALIEYAATHDSWDGAQSKVARLADLTGARIALTTPGRKPIAGSPEDALDAAVVSDVPTATVDPSMSHEVAQPSDFERSVVRWRRAVTLDTPAPRSDAA